MLKKSICYLLFITHLASVNASDHIDGAATIKDGQADLTDLYAFATPNKKNYLTVVLNMYPGVAPTGHFSSKVSYNIYIRSAKKNSSPLTPGFQTLAMDELNLNCRFTDPSHHTHNRSNESPKINCELKKENSVLTSLSGPVEDILENEVMRLYSGPRADAFFISAETFIKATGRKGFNSQYFKSGSNAMATINVMSIAVEIDMNQLGIVSELFAIAAQSYTDRSNVYEALDRIGRPEITNLSLHDYSGKNPLKRAYNKIHPFQPATTISDIYKQRLNNNIKAYDQLDQKMDWTDSELDQLSDIFIEDYLIINMNSSCIETDNPYLGVETEVLTGVELKSCGGRKISEDIMMRLYALYIGGHNADILNFQTGVSEPYQGHNLKKLQYDFPYLDTADNTSWKQWILFKGAKALQE